MGNDLLQRGKLDRRVTIVRDGAEAVNNRWTGADPAADTDSWGQEQSEGAGRIERWASARPAPGIERFANAENAASAPMRFVFGWEADLVRRTDRIEHDGQTYDIKSAIEIGRREGWEVLATARVENA